MSEEFKSIVNSSFDKGTPIWLYTNDYIYGLVPKDEAGSRWIEVSYTFEDPEEPLVKCERGANMSFQFLLEELGKGVAFYIEDFNVKKIKDFAKSLEGKPDPEKIKGVISELINNSAAYSKSLPIVKAKADLPKVTAKLK